MKELNELLDQIDAVSVKHYESLIPLHNHERLRGLCSERPIKIVTKEYYGCHELLFGSNGLYVDYAQMTDNGGYCESASYSYKECIFDVKDSVLKTTTPEGEKELLGLFPDLTSSALEEEVCRAIRNMPIYRKVLK